MKEYCSRVRRCIRHDGILKSIRQQCIVPSVGRQPVIPSRRYAYALYSSPVLPRLPPRPVNMKSSAHTVPVAFFPPTNDTISCPRIAGKTVAPTPFVSATQPLLVAVVWFIGSFAGRSMFPHYHRTYRRHTISGHSSTGSCSLPRSSHMRQEECPRLPISVGDQISHMLSDTHAAVSLVAVFVIFSECPSERD